jgi:hypothetical protein
MTHTEIVGGITGIAFSIPRFQRPYDELAAAEGFFVDRKGRHEEPDSSITLPKRLTPEEAELAAYRELLLF